MHVSSGWMMMLYNACCNASVSYSNLLLLLLLLLLLSWTEHDGGVGCIAHRLMPRCICDPKRRHLRPNFQPGSRLLLGHLTTC